MLACVGQDMARQHFKWEVCLDPSKQTEESTYSFLAKKNAFKTASIKQTKSIPKPQTKTVTMIFSV